MVIGTNMFMSQGSQSEYPHEHTGGEGSTNSRLGVIQKDQEGFERTTRAYIGEEALASVCALSLEHSLVRNDKQHGRH